MNSAGACFETLRVEAGRVMHLRWHQARLDRTCRASGWPRYDLAALLSPPPGEWRCRFVYHANGFETAYLPLRTRRVETLKTVADETLEYAFKFTDRSRLDALYERRGAADDVLIVRHGLVTDTTIANVAFFIQGRWLTPDRPLLGGTTRARLLDEGLLVEAEVTEKMARKAEKIAVMNALSGFVEVGGGILA